MRFVSKILPLLMAALAVPGQAAELSAAQVAAVLGVPITKAKTEPNRASAKSIDTSYETAGGDAVVIVHRGPISLWAATRAAGGTEAEPFASKGREGYRWKGLNMVCAAGAAEFVCITPSVYYLMARKQPGDTALRALLDAAL